MTANAGPRTAVVLFTRDPRVHDHPPNRVAFLLDSLRDLDARLRVRGSGLVVRCDSVVDETSRLA